MRDELATRASVDPSSIQYTVGPYGKPHASHPAAAASWHVSLSHTQTMAGVALCQHAEVGFDVQHVGVSTDLPGVARRVFVAAEIAWLNAAGDPAERPWIQRFYTLWTAKEAWLKARGEGFSRAPTELQLNVTDDEIKAVWFAPGLQDEVTSWSFHGWWPTPDVAAAVATRTCDRRLVVTR